jgi:hypothetical protein
MIREAENNALEDFHCPAEIARAGPATTITRIRTVCARQGRGKAALFVIDPDFAGVGLDIELDENCAGFLTVPPGAGRPSGSETPACICIAPVPSRTSRRETVTRSHYRVWFS